MCVSTSDLPVAYKHTSGLAQDVAGLRGDCARMHQEFREKMQALLDSARLMEQLVERLAASKGLVVSGFPMREPLAKA